MLVKNGDYAYVELKSAEGGGLALTWLLYVQDIYI